MSATETGGARTSENIRVRGLKLPPPEPPRFSLKRKVCAAAALLILIAVGGAIAISAYRSREVADAKIKDDLKKSGPAWESFQATRYAELHRTLDVVVNNAGIISLFDEANPATILDTLKTEQASNARADFMVAVTPGGTAIARTDKPLPYSADMSRVPTISGALQGAQTQGIWISGGRLIHVVAAPVLEGGSKVVGVIAAAFGINDEVARNLKTLINTQVVFLADEAHP